jgi:cysteine synthase A
VRAALAAIGGTPLLQLPLPEGCRGSLWAKAELLQPGGSVKDRAALGCVEHGLATGALRPGQPVVEMTSGNMGAGLAVVCGVLGHPFTAYMSAGNSPERARMMQALGARVVLVDQVDGTPGQVTGADIAAASKRAREDAEASGAWYVDQFHNPGGLLAHQNGTAVEVWEQTGGAVDVFVACVGTGGTLVGTGRGLKARKPVTVLAVEPATSAVLAGLPVTDPRHVLQGAGYGDVPPHHDPDVVDGYLQVTDDEAVAAREWLGRRCGLHVGYTAAANVHAATSWLQQQDADLTVVTVLCDTGLKYP